MTDDIPIPELDCIQPATGVSASDYFDETGAPRPADDQAGPTRIAAGTFALYQDGHGGFVLVADTAEFGKITKHVPSAIVKLATGGGALSRRMSALFS